MARITKEIATIIAVKLTVKKNELISNLENKFKDELLRMYVKDTPKEIIELQKKHPVYFKMSNRISMGGINGFSYEIFKVDSQIILKQDNNYYTNISAENSKKLQKIHNELQDKIKEVKSLIRDLEILLYSLRTYAKVSEQFPEAIPFLPKEVTTALSINISDIRKRI